MVFFLSWIQKGGSSRSKMSGRRAKRLRRWSKGRVAGSKERLVSEQNIRSSGQNYRVVGSKGRVAGSKGRFVSEQNIRSSDQNIELLGQRVGSLGQKGGSFPEQNIRSLGQKVEAFI